MTAITGKQIAGLAAAALWLAADDIDAQPERRPHVGLSLIRTNGSLPAMPAADDVQDGGAFAQAPRDALTVLATHLGLDTSSGTLSAVNAWSHRISRREVTAAMREAAAELAEVGA